jgi:hypothetical protein
MFSVKFRSTDREKLMLQQGPATFARGCSGLALKWPSTLYLQVYKIARIVA